MELKRKYRLRTDNCNNLLIVPYGIETAFRYTIYLLH